MITTRCVSEGSWHGMSCRQPAVARVAIPRLCNGLRLKWKEHQMSDRIQLDSVAGREIVPGYTAQFIHSKTMTVAYWDIKAGHSLPAHSHVHEQIVNMLEGEFELTVAGNPLRLVPGDVVVLHSNVEHAGRAITDCRILDVFQPVREDYVFE